jgi:hypothetical protein
MTKAQYDRQMKKIQGCVFETMGEEEDDGTYVANIKPEIIEIITDNIPLNEGMDEETLGKSLQKVVIALTKHIVTQTTGLNETLLVAFVTDFVGQSMESVFQIEERDSGDSESGSDFMYG